MSLKALNAELRILNAEVKSALAKRRKWMDEHMADFARFQIGETIYDSRTERKLGVISKLYRYHGEIDNHDFDTDMHIEYEFKTSDDDISIRGGIYDNTSRYAGALSICTKVELIHRPKRYRILD